jgi:hypothetical protein
MTKMMVLHPDRIMNLGRLDSALALAISMARYFNLALWRTISCRLAPPDLVSFEDALPVLQ